MQLYGGKKKKRTRKRSVAVPSFPEQNSRTSKGTRKGNKNNQISTVLYNKQVGQERQPRKEAILAD